MSGKTTATADNALTQEEVDERLARVTVARIGTIRRDGTIHLTPVWFLWQPERGRFVLSFGSGRLHVKNLRRNPSITLLIDEDPRPERGLDAGAWAVAVRGTAELVDDDEDLISEVARGLLGKALGEEEVEKPHVQEYMRQARAEGRTTALVTPESWLTWDYNKAD